MFRFLAVILLSAICLLLAPSSPALAQDEKGALYPFERVVAVCIGVEEFEDARIPKASFAEADAKAMRDLFRDVYGYETVLLDGPRASKKAIDAKLLELNQQLGEKDALLIFIATHGQILIDENAVRHGFLVTYDTPLDFRGNQLNVVAKRSAEAKSLSASSNEIEGLRETAIDMKSLVKTLNESEAKDVLLLVDACYSGFLMSRSIDGAIPQLLHRRSSRVVVSACAQDQKAYPDKNTNHGYFTAALLKQLSRRSAVSMTEVHVKARDEVAANSGQQMIPIMAPVGGDGGEFVFLPRAQKRDRLELVLKDLDRRARDLLGVQVTLQDVINVTQLQNYRYTINPNERERKWKKEFQRFQNGATFGEPYAMAALHYCYAKGIGVEKSDALAYQWAQRAWESTQPVGLHVMGRCLLYGVGVEKNVPAATKLLEEASERGYAYSDVTLAFTLMDGRGVSTIPSEEARIIEKRLETAVKAGIPAGKRLYGLMQLFDYEYRKSDRDRGFRLLKQAAMEGDVYSHVLVAEMLMQEPANLREARLEVLKAADAGEQTAQHWAAQEYLGFSSRFGVNVDPAKGLSYATHAAEQGNADSMILLTHAYWQGVGVEPDENKARFWCKKAEAANHSEAIGLLTFFYWTGNVYPQDFQKAYTFAKRGAQQNNLRSRYVLADYYYTGFQLLNGKENPRNFHHDAIAQYMNIFTSEFFNQLPEDQKQITIKRLEELRGDLNIEKQGLPLGEVPSAHTVFERLKKKYPNEAKDFARLILKQKMVAVPMPADRDTVILEVDRKLLLFGIGVGDSAEGAHDRAMKEAWKSALIEVFLDQEVEINEVDEKALGIIIDSQIEFPEVTTSFEHGDEVLSMVCLAVDRDQILALLRKNKLPVNEGDGGLFDDDLSKEIEIRHSMKSLASLLSHVEELTLATERGPRPKKKSGEDKVEFQSQILVDSKAYRKLVGLVEFSLKHVAVRAAEYSVEIDWEGDGTFGFLWTRDDPNPTLYSGEKSLFYYQPKAMSEWPEMKKGEIPFFLIKDVGTTQLEERDADKDRDSVRFLYAVLPQKPELDNQRISRKLVVGLQNESKSSVVEQDVRLDEASIVGRFVVSYQIGSPLGREYQLTMMPLIGTRVFSARLSKPMTVELDVSDVDLGDVKDWFAELRFESN